MANSNFYANIGLNAGFTRSQSSSSSHTEGAAVTTLKPMDENSSITYSNVNSITYQGTQAQGGTFIYNNVANIQKEAVELHNSYTSSSSSRGINAGATIGYGHKIQTTGNGGSISASKSNQNTTETIYQNGNFQNVNEVHNNTGTMTLSGFNQEGGKVTGNIGKVEVISRQNTSITTGSSKGMSVGVSSQGIPTSVNVNASRTNGDRAFVDNQSTFIVGEGSNLHVGTVENTGAVIGKEGNSTFKIDTYVGKDIQNYDTMTTTGGSIGVSLGGKPKITNVGFNQDSRDKQGITRNTVVGDVEITEAEGSPINRDLGKANEVTKDTHSRTNINVEPQVIKYLTNPAKLKEDIGKAKEEINDIKWAIKESIHDRGDDNRNFFGQLSEVRLNKSLENITSERLIGKTVDTEIAGIFKDAYKDLGYDINIIFSDPKNSPQLLDEKGKPKTGTAYVRDEKGKKIKTIIINGEDPKNTTKAGLIETIVEEGSHVIGKVEGRQRKTGTDEKGLESTGRASNEYFAEKYKDDNPAISIHSDGKDYSNVDFGENVGDKYIVDKFENDKDYIEWKNLLSQKFLIDVKKGLGADQNLLNEVNEKLLKLVENNILLGEINNDKDVYKIMTGKEMKKGKNAILELWKDYVKADLNINETGEITISNADETDLLTWGFKKAIDSEKKVIIKIIDNDISKEEEEFFEEFKKLIKDSNVSETKRKIFLNNYKTLWESLYVNSHLPWNLNFSMITIIPKHDATINVVSKNENGESFVNEIKGNNPSKVAHETGHFIDRLLDREEFYKKLKNSGVGVIENKQEAYTSNHYLDNKNTKEVTFYPLNKDEVVAIWMENEIYKKQGKPERLYYNEDDRKNAKTIKYNGENPDID